MKSLLSLKFDSIRISLLNFYLRDFFHGFSCIQILMNFFAYHLLFFLHTL